jgi:phytoene dehydrogenase-like protein
MTLLDAVVVGSGPNGLAAAVTLARAGLAVRVLEAQPTLGGGARSVTVPELAGDMLFDLCSAVHPMAWASPFFRAFDLPAHGVELVAPDVAYAQPLDGGRAGIAFRDLALTADRLGPDGDAWRDLLGPLAAAWQQVTALAMGDKRTPRGMLEGVRSPLGHSPSVAALASMIRPGLRYGAGLLEQGGPRWDRRFLTDEAKALLTGVAAHTITPLPSLAGAGTSLLLAALAHADGGWAIPVGGSQAITDAMVRDVEAHGGTIEVDRRVESWSDLPPARAVLFDTTPGTLLRVAGDRIGSARRAALRRFRYGNAAAKVDFVLSAPVPWSVPDVGRASTVHLGGTRAEMVIAEDAVANGLHADRPVVLVSDPGVADPTRLRGTSRRDRPRTSPRRSPGRSNGSRPGSATSSWPRGASRPPRWSGTTRTTRQATSPRAPPPCGRWSRGPRRRPIRTRSPRGCTSARRRPRPGRACTAWAAGTPRAGRCCGSSTYGTCPA